MVVVNNDDISVYWAQDAAIDVLDSGMPLSAREHEFLQHMKRWSGKPTARQAAWLRVLVERSEAQGMISDFAPPASTTAIDWALAYAAAGMAVFPCGADKEPIGKLCPHGVKNATTDAVVIRRWWMLAPFADIGWAIPERPRRRGSRRRRRAATGPAILRS